MKRFFTVTLVSLLFGSSVYATDRIQASAVTWFDIRTADTVRSQFFYEKLFGWSFKEIFSGYHMISEGNKGIGGVATVKSPATGNQGTMLYFYTEDLKASYLLAISLGAQMEREPMNIPGFGAYAVIRDFDNNEIALFSDKPCETRTLE